MIYIIDNFLDKTLFLSLKSYLNNFKEVKTVNKSFWVMEPPEGLIDYISIKLSIIEKKQIDNILCFFRQAKKDQDNDWRIHNDAIIENQQPDRAVVLYMSNNEEELNGTAFWEHKDLGDTYNNVSPKEFNKLLNEDANNISNWKLKTIIGAKENRLLSYPCNYFHSKYPQEFDKERIVLVMFYKIKSYEISKTK